MSWTIGQRATAFFFYTVPGLALMTVLGPLVAPLVPVITAGVLLYDKARAS